MLHKDERRHEPQDEDLKGRLTTRRSAIDGAAWHEKSKMMVTQCATILLSYVDEFGGLPDQRVVGLLS